MELTDTISTTVTFGYQQNRYQGEVTVTEREGKLVEDILLGSVELGYAVPMEFLNLFLVADYRDKDSRLDLSEYDRYRITLGVRLQY